MIGFCTTRTLVPETDEVELRLTYTADLTARLSMEAVIEGGGPLIAETVEQLRDELTYDIIKDLG